MQVSQAWQMSIIIIKSDRAQKIHQARDWMRQTINKPFKPI